MLFCHDFVVVLTSITCQLGLELLKILMIHLGQQFLYLLYYILITLFVSSSTWISAGFPNGVAYWFSYGCGCSSWFSGGLVGTYVGLSPDWVVCWMFGLLPSGVGCDGGGVSCTGVAGTSCIFWYKPQEELEDWHLVPVIESIEGGRSDRIWIFSMPYYMCYSHITCSRFILLYDTSRKP